MRDSSPGEWRREAEIEKRTVAHSDAKQRLRGAVRKRGVRRRRRA